MPFIRPFHVRVAAYEGGLLGPVELLIVRSFKIQNQKQLILKQVPDIGSGRSTESFIQVTMKMNSSSEFKVTVTLTIEEI